MDLHKTENMLLPKYVILRNIFRVDFKFIDDMKWMVCVVARLNCLAARFYVSSTRQN